MDSLTQITLGAAVGELTLGKKVGNKAPLWGAVAGTIPDLDVLLNPFVSEVAQLSIHRGFSHSILFAFLWAPIFGYFIYKIHKNDNASLKDWIKLAFWCTITHPLLDSFTGYGTQLFSPFSDYRVEFNTIFVIDPIYTIPFTALMIAVLFTYKNMKTRRILNYVALSISSIYLLLTVANKLYINSVFEESFSQNKIEYNRFFTNPTPFNNILWRGVFETEDGYYEGYYSLFDESKEISFTKINRNTEEIRSIYNSNAIAELMWFSKEYYTITKFNNDIFFNDVRFGTLGGWTKPNTDYVFSYKIIESNDGLGIKRMRPDFKIDAELLQTFWSRIKGNKSLTSL
jgi:inner membrane protein